MSSIYYFRHSIKDGENNTLGPKGLELAKRVGSYMYREDDEFNPEVVFTGPLVRTVQTAYAFMQGLSEQCNCPIPVLLEAIPEFGNDGLFVDMVKPSEFRTLAAKMGNYRALLACHNGDVVGLWVDIATDAVKKMFTAMNEVQTAAAFGHSPMIELALAGILGSKELPEEYLVLKEMEGVLLEMDDAGNISVSRKISMPLAA